MNNTNNTFFTKTKEIIKPLLFLDIDEVILNTHETLIELLNEQFSLNGTAYELSTSDIKEWAFDTVLFKLNSSLENWLKELREKADNQLNTIIIPNVYSQKQFTLPLTKDFLIYMIETSDFWNKVKFKTGVVSLLSSIENKYHIYLITKGTEENIRQKKKWFKENSCFKTIDYKFLSTPEHESKEDVIMREMACFITNTISQGVKPSIVFNSLQVIQVDDNYSNLSNTCNLHILLKEQETDYNQVEDVREDLYIVNNLDEIEQTLEFYSTYYFDNLEKIKPKKKTLMEYIKNIIKIKEK